VTETIPITEKRKRMPLLHRKQTVVGPRKPYSVW